MVLSGFRRTLEPQDLPALEASLTADGVYPEFERVWRRSLDAWRASQSQRPAPTTSQSHAHTAGNAVDLPLLSTSASAPTGEKCCDADAPERRPLDGSRDEDEEHAAASTCENPALSAGAANGTSAKANARSADAERPNPNGAVDAGPSQTKQPESARVGPALLLVLLRLFWPTLLEHYVLRFLHDVVVFIKPFLLGCVALRFTSLHLRLHLFNFKYIELPNLSNV